MKWGENFFVILLSLVFISFSSAQQDDFPVLKGPYFGKEVPQGKAEVFMDGAISKLHEDEMGAAFTADGREFYYNARHEGTWAIFMTKEVDGQWVRPVPMPFTSVFTDRDFTMSPDGDKIFFGSNRPRSKDSGPSESLDIFFTGRLAKDLWSEPESIGDPINTDRSENYPSCARNRNLYFFSSRDDGFGGCDIYVSRWENGQYSVPENLGPEINSDKHDWDAFIAPDESVIVFSSQNRPDSIGKQDLYISYKNEDGGWTDAKNMGPSVNSPDDEICPSLSLDGKYLFFTSRRRGKADIFWIDARIIEELRPKIEFPVLEGPYLGQNPPGLTPEVFAPGIISRKNYNEASFCAYMDGDSLFLFTRSSPGTSGQIYYPIQIMTVKDGAWTQPYLATFHNQPCDRSLSIIPDGKTLYFGSQRSINGRGKSSKGFNIWVVRRTAYGFSNPRMLDPPVNSADYDIYPSASKDGTLYFFSERSGGFGGADIYRSRLVDGKYTSVENIGPPVNTENVEIDPFIAADESYLIYCSKTLGGYGGHDLYIVFRKRDGSWSEPVNMGPEINSSAYDWIPYVTSDGKYFFFTSNRSGDYDIFWIDARIIENLRPKHLK